MASPPKSPSDPTARLVGDSPAMQAVRAQLRHLAAFDTLGNPDVPTLLLQGETGTGKGLVARVMHDSGPRAAGPFVEVNCAAIPDTLLEAELFGYEAGAFSEAKRAKPGLFEAASGGTLFLDEIDALPMVLQGKLLTVLEAKRVRRLGAVREQAVDVKLTAAAQTDLGAAVQAGRFRADLYHRLAVVVLTLPPLRERGEDILLLARASLQRYAAAHRVRPKSLSPGAEAWLRGHPWPGNVRELSHLLERVMLLSPEPLVEADTLARLSLSPTAPITHTAAPPACAPDQPLEEAARIRQVLEAVGGNVVQAARQLGISRGGLRYRLQRYGIEPPPQGVGPVSRSTRSTPAVPVPTEIPDARPPVEAPAPTWEQKPVVVLALDLTFPTALEAEAWLVEPWTAAHRWEQAIEAKVQGFGGTVLSRLSSLCLVAFGVPHTLEQLPQRAVQAALAIRQLVREVEPEAAREPVPTVRQAVHLGTMRVETQAGALSARSQVEGATLSVAVRLLGHADPGELLVSAPVARLVADGCALQALDVPAGTGAAGPLPAYRVEGRVAQHEALAGWGARVLSRFVGRARELTVLDECLAHAAAGRGQVVGLVGEPGVGKSRLVYECTRALPAAGWQLLACRAVGYGQATPYGPVLDLVKAACQVADGETGEVTRQKVLDRLAGCEALDRQVRPALLSLLDVPVEDPAWEALDPTQRRRQIQAAVQGLLLGDSQRHPLLLVVEDLQWLDSESQAVLDTLVERLPAARLLVLATYRPEYQHGWANKTSYTPLRLDPLPPAPAHELLRAWLGEATARQPLSRLLLERTEGNPFFLEESLHTLVETQVLAGERGAYRLVRSPPRLTVPTTVQAVLAARIDRLPPDEKHLLQTAAVIGTDVPLPLLQALVEADVEALDRGLDHMQAAEFLYQTRLGPEGAYTFKHALTQEVAYATLPQERRRALHARIVATLEEQAGERLAELVERLAHHALRGEVWDKALAYGRQAGEKAMARSAYREAVGYFEQALSALPHLPETRDTREQAIDLRLALRSALLPSGNFGRILAYLREAEALAATLDYPRRLGQVSLLLSNYFYRMGAYDQAISSGERALALATAHGDVVLQALANRYLGVAYEAQGDYRRAIDCLRQTVASLDGARRRERFGRLILPAVHSRAWLAACHAELGIFVEGKALGNEGLRIAEAVAHPASLMVALRGIGLLALRQGDLPRAIPVLERALGICQDADFPVYFPAMAASLGAAYTLAGRVADAVPLLTQAMEQTIAPETAVYQALCSLSLGEAQLLAGHLEEAHALAEWALAHAREHQERSNQAWVLRLLGDIAAQGESAGIDQAAAHYRQALALAEELGMRPLMAHCHLGLGRLYAMLGRCAEARADLSTAVEWYRAMAMTFWLPDAEAALAELDGC